MSQVQKRKLNFLFSLTCEGFDVYRLIYKESIQLQDVEGFGKFNFCVS
jgi:hypothetical protein